MSSEPCEAARSRASTSASGPECQRFGRFPHRNAILGRTPRPEETKFLAEGGFAG
jgi:uncharacterized protein (DUF924 family)